MNRRMRQILVHSCIYYEFNQNIVSDHVYDAWGNELTELIKKYPEMLSELEYGFYFIDYVEMPSGFNLQYRDPKIMSRAAHLLKIKR